MYVQGQKSLADAQELLEQVTLGIDDPHRTDEEKKVLYSVHAELEDVEERILKSIERNEVKGVQNALAGNLLRQHQEARQLRRSRQDSAYASSIGSTETHQKPPSLISRRTTESGESRWSEVVLQAATTQPDPEQTFSPYTTENIYQAEILFNNAKHQPICLPCTVVAKYKGEWLSEIFPDYAGKLPERLEAPDAPALVFTKNAPRPIPHVEPRGSRADPNRHLVQLKGNTNIFPIVKSLEYIFASAKGSS
jgi:hypothetical protein